MQDGIVFHDPEHTVSVAMAEHTVHVIVVHVDGFTGVGEMPVHVFQKEACGFLFEQLIFVMFQYGFQFPAVFTGFFQRLPDVRFLAGGDG